MAGRSAEVGGSRRGGGGIDRVPGGGIDRVTVNPMALLALPFDQEAAALVAAGARRLGVATRKLDALGWAAGLATYRAAGLDVAYLVHGIVAAPTDRDGWAAEADLLVRAVDTAADLGVPFVYFCSGPPGAATRWEDAVAALGDRLAPVVARARAAGVGLALENALSVRTDHSFMFTLRDTAAAARRLGVGVCADLYCCWMEPDLPATLAANVDLLHLVQVSDRDQPSMVQPDRRVPGDGDLPLDQLIGDVLAAGYRGPFDLELLGPHIDAEGGPGAVRRGVAWIAAALDRVPDRPAGDAKP
ncbi:MAG TPA: TIM barrel protein [Acidimicrobiales bacterium]|nr:TIM barrel protein [Acidimicrobiales bacterium]